MLTEEQKLEKIKNRPTIWGTGYGEPYEEGSSFICEIKEAEYKVIPANHQYGVRIYFEWGWPGPDHNYYNWEDYGITWAFSKQEIMDCHEVFKKFLSSVSPTERFRMFCNPKNNVEEKFIEITKAAIVEDLKRLEILERK